MNTLVKAQSFKDIKPVRVTTSTFALFVIGLLALGLRIWGIDNESLWLDEATSLNIARMSLANLDLYLLKSDVHPPLYFVLLHFWLEGGESIVYLRLLSVLAGVLTIPAFYLMGKELFDERVSLIAVLFLAISPFHIYYSQMVRSYTLFTLFTVLSFYCLLRAADENKGGWWELYAVCALASLYTHYFAVFTLFFQNLFVVPLVYLKRRSWQEWWPWLLASFFIVVLFLPWLLNSAFLTGQASPGWLAAQEPPSINVIIGTLNSFNLGESIDKLYPRWARYISYLLFGGLLAAAFFKAPRPGPLLARLQQQRGLWMSLGYLFFPLLLIWLISQARIIYVNRYLAPFMMAYYLLLAAGIVALRKNWLQSLAVGLSVLLILPGIWLTFQIPQVNDWRVISNYVLTRMEPDDMVVFAPPWYQRPFDYYAQGRVKTLEYPASFTPERVCQEVPAGQSRLWFIQPVGSLLAPENSLSTCLESRFDVVDEFHFGPYDGKILLYDLGVPQ